MLIRNFLSPFLVSRPAAYANDRTLSLRLQFTEVRNGNSEKPISPTVVRCKPRRFVKIRLKFVMLSSGAFLAAAVWGGQQGSHNCIWGRARIPDVIMCDWVSGVIWHQLCNVSLLSNLATLPAMLLDRRADEKQSPTKLSRISFVYVLSVWCDVILLVCGQKSRIMHMWRVLRLSKGKWLSFNTCWRAVLVLLAVNRRPTSVAAVLSGPVSAKCHYLVYSVNRLRRPLFTVLIKQRSAVLYK